MAFRVAELHHILGSSLTSLWMSDAGRNRAVVCVTSIGCDEDAAGARNGELMVLAAPDISPAAAHELIDAALAARPSVVLVPASCISAAETRRLREIGMAGETVIGLLADKADPRTVVTCVSRAVASSFGSIESSRLHAAQNLQDLAETLGRLVGNSVTIETPNHDVLAFSPTGHDVDQDRVNTILRRHAAARIMEHPDFIQFVTQVRASDWPVHFAAHPEFGNSGRIAMRIASDGELFGIIWATDTARPLTDQDYAVIRQAAEVAAALLVRRQSATRREAMLRAELLDDIMEGRISNPENVRTVAHSVGWNVDRLQQALVVAIDDFEAFRLRHAARAGAALRREQERLVELVRLDVLAVDPQAIVGMRSSSVVVLLDVGRDAGSDRKAAVMQLAESIVRRSVAFLHDTRVTVGVGRDFPSFEHLAESIRQAELAAEFGQTLWGGNRALHYDDLGIHRVLFALREHEGMVPPALQRIVRHDEEHGTDYAHTLAIYLRHMGRLRTAAAELGIHRNTLEYRVGRIAELAEADLEDADMRLALELGIRLLELEGGTPRLRG
jgi:sugar diacid utilization regulator